MNKFNTAYKEVIEAKSVKVKQDRLCRKCNRTITNGSNAITASHLLDKKYNVTFKDVVDRELSAGGYKFVPVRHWFCLECYEDILNSSKNLCKNRINLSKNEVEDIIYSNEFAELSEDAQLEQIQTFYAKGLISTREFDYLERELIHAMALRDAYFNEF